jgi:tripartite-type tricarboxylate transporter receptor subunit TctC
MAWVGLSAPRGTPDAVVQKIHAALRAAMDKPALLAQLQADGMTPMPLSPERYAALVKGDTERWGALVRSLNLKAN